MHKLLKFLFTILTTVGVFILSHALAYAGTLTMENTNTQTSYCATFDLWSASGPRREQMCAPPTSSRQHSTSIIGAYGKIAVYKTDRDGNHFPSPEARYNPDGLLLPSRSFRIVISPDGSVRISEVN